MPSSDTQYELARKVSVKDLLPLLTYEFPDAPDGMLEYVALRKVIEFCRRTNALRRVTDIITQPCVLNYRLEPPDSADTDLVAVMRMAHLPTRWCAPEYSRVTVHNGRRCCMCQGFVSYVEGNELIFMPPPKGKSVFRVEISVCPKPDSCDVDASLLDFEHTLLDGIRAELFAQPNKPWSSAARSQTCEVAYRQGCADASVEVMAHHQRGSFTRHRRAF